MLIVSDTRRLSLKRIGPALFCGVLFAADQLLKRWCDQHLHMFAVQGLTGFSSVALTKVMNPGLALGTFSGGARGQGEVWFLSLPTLAGCAFVMFEKSRWKNASRAERAGVMLIVAGGASNLLDHWRSPFVLDSLRLSLASFGAIAFNLADVWILVGLGLVLVSVRRQWSLSAVKS